MLNGKTFMDFKKKLLERKTVLGLAMQSCEAAVAEIIARTGFEFVWIDMEHTALSFRDVEKLIIVLENKGCVPLVRVRHNEANCIGQVLDMGARIVNVPHVDTVQDAERAVQGAKYFPLGRRGFSTYSRSTGQGTHKLDTMMMQEKNNETMLMVQIESEEAVRNVNDIAVVEGIEILFVGYADLCQDMGLTADPHYPRFEQAIQKVGNALKQSGKIGAFIIFDPREISYYHELGFDLICCGMDTAIMKNGVQALFERFKPRVNP